MSHSDDDNDERETWFAGGERSGISVQNPRRRGEPGGDLVRDLLRRAQEWLVSSPLSTDSADIDHREGATSGEPAQSRPNIFTGGGHTLGGEGVSSAYVPGAQQERDDDLAIRRLTFWRDGFTVEDGPLMRYDDPANADVLAAIHAGHAPPSILNVRLGQRVDVQVTKRTEDNYVPPPPKPFSGSGNRLGAPVPAATVAPSSSSAAPAASASGSSPRFEVDQSQPTTSVQIRLADGTRIVCRMNLTHTVLDLRNFINGARPENLTRPYTIGTTFPNRTLDDNSATIEGAGLKNSVVVQRWV
ncbi:SEP-domain-containing protein [Mycena sanguinolenta]|uniref:SEP-domain-containing protein n=1 Tax=Mycena sanguinolenta TaxID=230812 RepID=A0A8H6Y1S3_9AGAR|nr:SEP-domain-containing protein [Mycena sanguinolenta]